MKYKDLDSPSLIIFKDWVEKNIDEMIKVAGGAARLMPHAKTNKMEAVIKLMVAKGITRFKAATIAEAELAAMSGASFVLISHQLVGPKIDRLKKLTDKYGNTAFATLVDCVEVVDELSSKMQNVSVYLDINNGMNRTGHEVNDDLDSFLEYILSNNVIKIKGLHIYDGHITDAEFEERKLRINTGMELLNDFIDKASKKVPDLELVCGGSPAFTTHVLEENRILSPGTSVFWDWGYGDKFKEQHFTPAAFVLTRVISKPTADIITVDMGHKAVSAENPIDFRIRFPENPDLKLISQSEEHGVLKTDKWESYKVGDILLGIPYHVCPTVNLYDQAYVFSQDEYLGQWDILGRKRMITI
jgi:3-hydroxy-D-aspartate aldolase